MYKVLIVDDEPFILDGLKQVICWEDYDLEIVGQASNGIDALKFIENNKVNILITDIKMPRMNGLELIKNIRSKGMNTKCIVLSGYDDFSYVKEAAILGIENYLLKPVDIDELIPTLQNTINKIENELYKQIEENKGINIIRDNIFYRWITNDISEEEFLDRAELLDINVNRKNYIISVLRILDVQNRSQSSIVKDKSLLRFAVNNICSQTVSENFRGAVFNNLTGDITILFHSINSNEDRRLVEATLKECIKNINKYVNADVFVTIGSLETDYATLSQSYSNAVNLQEYLLISSPNKIVFYDEISHTDVKKQKDLHIDYKSLKNLILSKDKNGCNEFTTGLFGQLKELHGLTPAYIQSIAVNFFICVTENIKEIRPNSDVLSDELRDSFYNVVKFRSLNDFLEWINWVIGKSIDFLLSTDEKTSPVIKKILEYIQNNYSQDINLKTISSHFNINSVYLGQLFKKETGDSFTNYLNKIRVDKAKELLINTNMKATEISVKIGYTNTNYFYTIFKKVTGLSPSDYKGE